MPELESYHRVSRAVKLPEPQSSQDGKAAEAAKLLELQIARAGKLPQSFQSCKAMRAAE